LNNTKIVEIDKSSDTFITGQDEIFEVTEKACSSSSLDSSAEQIQNNENFPLHCQKNSEYSKQFIQSPTSQSADRAFMESVSLLGFMSKQQTKNDFDQIETKTEDEVPDLEDEDLSPCRETNSNGSIKSSPTKSCKRASSLSSQELQPSVNSENIILETSEEKNKERFQTPAEEVIKQTIESTYTVTEPEEENNVMDEKIERPQLIVFGSNFQGSNACQETKPDFSNDASAESTSILSRLETFSESKKRPLFKIGSEEEAASTSLKTSSADPEKVLGDSKIINEKRKKVDRKFEKISVGNDELNKHTEEERRREMEFERMVSQISVEEMDGTEIDFQKTYTDLWEEEPTDEWLSHDADTPENDLIDDKVKNISCVQQGTTEKLCAYEGML
jgi:hypothetical protein